MMAKIALNAALLVAMSLTFAANLEAASPFV